MMKKFIVTIMFLLSLNIYSQENYELISYIPTDGEIQYLMNLYERLKSIDTNEMDYTQLGEIYSTFENRSERYYNTYQRLLFESYLLYTKNQEIQKYISTFIIEQNYKDDFSLTLLKLYKGVEEKYINDNKDYKRYVIENSLVDEYINLFNMYEVTVFNGNLGLMLFDNDWTVVSIEDNNPNESNISLIYGGGTNSVAYYLKEITNISFDNFKSQEIDGTFYKEKYSDYQVFELPLEGVLSRAGANYIFMGVGNDVDIAFPNVINFSSVLYLYSEEKKTGYKIDLFMNIAENNNNFKIKESIFNHLIFQSMFSFINY